jgi:hypothetical protein
MDLGAKIMEYVPKVEVEYFNLDDKDKAKAWLN